MENLSVVAARRLALARGGLLRPEWTGMPRRASGRGVRARRGAHRIIQRFGYLQLDTVSVAGARSHAIVLLSRLHGFEPNLAEQLLQPGQPLFEYWGHEASWMPIELYPVFAFRRAALAHHPWWGDLIGEHPEVAGELLRRIRDEGPLRTLDMEGRGSRGWWDLKLAKKVATALWSSGELAIRERRGFQRTYDLTERVIPKQVRERVVAEPEALEQLVLRALSGHGWASTTTIVQTWRLSRQRRGVEAAIERLRERGQVAECALTTGSGARRAGWVRPRDLELAARLERSRPRRDRGVLLSPFDPLLWDRARVEQLFGFHQVLEIFKPAAQRIYGYYCLPVLAGERLVGRYDLKADRGAGQLQALSCHLEADAAVDRQAARTALERFARSLQLTLVEAR